MGRAPLVLGGWTLGGIAADNLLEYMKWRQNQVDQIQEVFGSESDLSRVFARNRRFFNLDQAYQDILPFVEREKKLRQQLGEDCELQCTEVYRDYIDHVQETFSELVLAEYQADLSHLESKESALFGSALNESEEAYLTLLRGFFPLILQIATST